MPKRFGFGRRTWRRCAIAAVAVVPLIFASCAVPAIPASQPAGGQAARGSSPRTPADPPGSGGLAQEDANAEAQRILAEVATARNLEVTAGVHVDVIDKEGIRSFARHAMYEDTTPEKLALLGSVEASMGVLPVGSDPEAIILDLLEEGVLGLYDPKSKTLFIGDFVSTAMLSMVVGHEIAHGLQDMHFDLDRFKKPIDHHADMESARTFLVEGGAQAAYLAWVSGDIGLRAIDDAVLSAMGNQALELAGEASEYPILARSLQMPYADGTATIIRLVLRKGWSAVDKLYRDPPTTTEQMLHIDKLLAREPATEISLDADALAQAFGMAAVWHDEIGEASLLAMMAQTASALEARRAAAGWGGATLQALNNPDDPQPAPVVVAATTWDSEHDAVEFEAVFRRYLDAVVGGRTFIQRRDDVVVFATALPADAVPETVAPKIWKALSVAKPSRSPAGRRAN